MQTLMKGCLLLLLLGGPAPTADAGHSSPTGSIVLPRMSADLVIGAETTRLMSDERGNRASTETEATSEPEGVTMLAKLLMLLSFLALILGLLFHWSSDQSYKTEGSVFVS